jgi:hypothetical protein
MLTTGSSRHIMNEQGMKTMGRRARTRSPLVVSMVSARTRPASSKHTRTKACCSCSRSRTDTGEHRSGRVALSGPAGVEEEEPSRQGGGRQFFTKFCLECASKHCALVTGTPAQGTGPAPCTPVDCVKQALPSYIEQIENVVNSRTHTGWCNSLPQPPSCTSTAHQ